MNRNFPTKKFVDGRLVEENKMTMFLILKVLNRPLRGNRYKKDRVGQDGNSTVQKLSSQTVEGYVSALMNLYRT